ncbi:hypothetical protein BJY52DRAFT_1227800 [Lactarius psammicola]|nr:hypothetical protein BJY52DRAFT_1227800 [Lactarius psammicola]
MSFPDALGTILGDGYPIEETSTPSGSTACLATPSLGARAALTGTGAPPAWEQRGAKSAHLHASVAGTTDHGREKEPPIRVTLARKWEGGWGPLPIPTRHSVRVSPLRRPGGGAPFVGLRAAPVRMPPLSVQTGTGRNGEGRANPLVPASRSRVALHATGGVGALVGLRLAMVHVPPLRTNEGGGTQMMGWREPPPLLSLCGQLSCVALCAREVEGGKKGGSSFTFPRGLTFACSLWVQKGGWGGPLWGGRAGNVARPPACVLQLHVNGDEAKEGGTPSNSRANRGGRCKGERNGDAHSPSFASAFLREGGEGSGRGGLEGPAKHGRGGAYVYCIPVRLAV